MLMEMLRSADEAASDKDVSAALTAMRFLFDNQSFVRLSAFMTRTSGVTDPDGVICAYGAVEGKPVFAFSEDADLCGAAMTKRHVEKIKALYKRAKQNGAPVVGFFNSVGGYLDEGSAVLSAYGELIDCVCSAKGLVPQIAIVNGNCTGMLSSVAQMFDFVIVVKGSKFYFLPPFIVGDGASGDDVAAKKGLAAKVAESVEDASALARALVAMLPLNKNDSSFIGDCGDDINRTCSISAEGDYDVLELIKEVSDNKKFVEIYEEYASAVKVGFASFDGIVCGVVANDHSVNDGALTVDCCNKISDFIDFCSMFGIAVVTLVDTKGFDVSSENADAGIMPASARLAVAYSRCKCAKITVIVGKAYGAGFTVMGSRSLGADEVLALRSAVVSVMPPESAVAFMHNDEITGSKTREELESEWISNNCSAVLAAANGDVDDVIDATFLRAHICTAVGMFSSKSASVL